MKAFLFTIAFLPAFFADGQKQAGMLQPQWNVSFHFDHISFPFFGKYKPGAVKSLDAFAGSWRLSVGRAFFRTGDDHTGGIRTLSLGYIRNRQLQQGITFNYQEGIHFQPDQQNAVFGQAGIDGGAMLLFQRTNATVHQKRFNHKKLRLQWTTGLTVNAGYAQSVNHIYGSAALSYKLWVQGPFIRKYVPALPHQSIGLIVSN